VHHRASRGVWRFFFSFFLERLAASTIATQAQQSVPFVLPFRKMLSRPARASRNRGVRRVLFSLFFECLTSLTHATKAEVNTQFSSLQEDIIATCSCITERLEECGELLLLLFCFVCFQCLTAFTDGSYTQGTRAHNRYTSSTQRAFVSAFVGIYHSDLPVHHRASRGVRRVCLCLLVCSD